MAGGWAGWTTANPNSGRLEGASKAGRRTVGQNNQECKETAGIKCVSHVEKLDSKFLPNKKKKFLGSLAHLILRFAIVQNKSQVLCYQSP